MYAGGIVRLSPDRPVSRAAEQLCRIINNSTKGRRVKVLYVVLAGCLIGAPLKNKLTIMTTKGGPAWEGRGGGGFSQIITKNNEDNINNGRLVKGVRCHHLFIGWRDMGCWLGFVFFVATRKNNE